MRALLAGCMALVLASGLATAAQASLSERKITRASAVYTCSGWGSTTLDISVTTASENIIISLWGKGYDNFMSGLRMFSTDGVRDDTGTGGAMVCGAGRTTTCRDESAQINFTQSDIRPGGTLAGTITIAGQTVPFQTTTPSSKINCQ